MSLAIFLLAAIGLSLERICYVYIWHAPNAFRAFCCRPSVSRLGSPVDVLQTLFYGFKLIQLTIFFGWCYVFGEGALLPLHESTLALIVGSGLIAGGQILNFGVFYRLGKVGVFYGNKMGYEIPWCDAFPFSMFKHPQYAGALCSIWGFFLVMRFPHDDWLILPMLETVYYAVGAHFEN